MDSFLVSGRPGNLQSKLQGRLFPVRKCSQIWSVRHLSDPPRCQSKDLAVNMVILRVKQAQGSVGLYLGIVDVFEAFGSLS